MSKRTLYSVITPLPAGVSRATAVEALHNHHEMIALNPLVINHVPCPPHAQAPPDEFHAIWYELTDKVSYLPGVSGEVKYKACFHDLPRGLQTHVYAPTGLDIKEKWVVGGNEPGEPREVLELGMHDIPRDGLYVREEVDMRCNFLLTSFVKKNLRRAHEVLISRLIVKTDLVEDRKIRQSYAGSSYTERSRAHSVRSDGGGFSGYAYGSGGTFVQELDAAPQNPQVHEMDGKSPGYDNASSVGGATDVASSLSVGSGSVYSTPYSVGSGPYHGFQPAPVVHPAQAGRQHSLAPSAELPTEGTATLQQAKRASYEHGQKSPASTSPSAQQPQDAPPQYH